MTARLSALILFCLFARKQLPLPIKNLKIFIGKGKSNLVILLRCTLRDPLLGETDTPSRNYCEHAQAVHYHVLLVLVRLTSRAVFSSDLGVLYTYSNKHKELKSPSNGPNINEPSTNSPNKRRWVLFTLTNGARVKKTTALGTKKTVRNLVIHS